MEASVQRPPLSAVAKPLREVQWTRESQTALLRHELLDLSLYRRLEESDSVELLNKLESEFDALLAAPQPIDDIVFLRFPPMPSRYRKLVTALAERYRLRPAQFGEDKECFVVTYKHPGSLCAPILRIDDFVHAAAYYEPPPPPAAQVYKRNAYIPRQTRDDFEFEGTEVPLRQDYGRWTRDGCQPAPRLPPSGYQCEFAGCHEHIIELSSFEPELDASELAELGRTATCAATRLLPDGVLLVFRTRELAEAFVGSHGAQTEPSEPCSLDGGLVRLALSLGSVRTACTARALASLQRRPQSARQGAAGKRAAPRGFTSALKQAGIGTRPEKQAGGISEKRASPDAPG